MTINTAVTGDTVTVDVAIIGGGMVGASLALALSDSPLKVAVIDQQSLSPEWTDELSEYSPRVSGLTGASIGLLQGLGAWELMKQQRVCSYENMYVWDGEGTGSIAFSAHDAGLPNLGHIVENSVICNALLQRLNEAGILLYPEQKEIQYDLDGELHQVFLSGTTLKTKLLVATDGAESPLRKASGIPSSQKDYLHHAVVTTVETELPHQDTAWQVFLDSGPLAFLPLPDRNGKHYCSIVWSLVPDRAREILALDDNGFCRRVESAFEQKLGRVISTDPRFCFPLKQRHAQQYHRNRVVLAGDSAHTIHPLAGQGVNLGLQDVSALSEELLRAVERADDFSADYILNRYERRRRGSNLLMMKTMEGFQNLFAANDLGIRWLRNTGLKVTNQLPFVKERLVKQAMGYYTNPCN